MKFVSKTKTAVCAAALFAAVGTFAVRAQDGAAPAAPAAPAPAVPAAGPAEPVRNPADVVARVGSETVTEADIAIAREALGAQLGQVPQAEQRGRLVDFMVDMELRAQAAREAGLDQGPDYKAQLEFLQLRALQDLYIEKNVSAAITPDDLQKAYETLVTGQFKPEEQVRARHILVETKEAADKIIADLKGGAAFEELAKQSKDATGQNGGDLGYFGRGQMVPPFEAAAFALEPGAVTEEPVESQFGWHVIKVEDKRMSQPPALADIEADLRNYVMQQKFEAAMTGLRAKYKVEIVGDAAPAGEPATGTAPAPQPATGASAPETPAADAPAAPADEPTAPTAPQN